MSFHIAEAKMTKSNQHKILVWFDIKSENCLHTALTWFFTLLFDASILTTFENMRYFQHFFFICLLVFNYRLCGDPSANGIYLLPRVDRIHAGRNTVVIPCTAFLCNTTYTSFLMAHFRHVKTQCASRGTPGWALFWDTPGAYKSAEILMKWLCSAPLG